MRDSGFEFNYKYQWYSAQNGFICKIESDELIEHINHDLTDVGCIPDDKFTITCPIIN